VTRLTQPEPCARLDWCLPRGFGTSFAHNQLATGIRLNARGDLKPRLDVGRDWMEKARVAYHPAQLNETERYVRRLTTLFRGDSMW
jgi:hypothetical protein